MGESPTSTPENTGLNMQTDPKQDLSTRSGHVPENAKNKDLTPDVPPRYDEDEINLLDYWRVIWKRRKLIGYIVLAMVVLTAVVSLFMTNIYQAEAVIAPINNAREGGGGMAALLAQQLGGGLPGIMMTGAASSAAEIINLLKSNVLREKIIVQYNLLPVLFDKQWDEKKGRWKAEVGEIAGSNIDFNPLSWVAKLLALLRPAPQPSIAKKPGIPDIWDGIRALSKLVSVKHNIKENSITVTGQFRDPDLAAKLVEYFLKALTDHMSAEARRVALINQKHLESQLGVATDPFIKQKIFNLIAQQVETSMMAEVKENFAFKVIDPPKAPDRKIKPKRAQMVILSFVVALFIGIFAAFLLEYLEKQNINIGIPKSLKRFVR